MSFALRIIKMSKKTLKFDDIVINKKGFHKSKQPVDLNLVNVDQVLISEKFKHSDMVLNILLVIKKMKLLNRYVLSYFK